MFGSTEAHRLFCLQIADNGPANVSELWWNLLVIGTLANGERTGEAKKGAAEMNCIYIFWDWYWCKKKL